MINKKVMFELDKKMPKRTIYWRIEKIQKECLTTKEDAANLLAFQQGIPVHRILSEPELRRLRELQETLRTAPLEKTIRKKAKAIEKKMGEDKESITPNMLYDSMEFHPRIIRASRSQFRSRHYSDAIFNAFKCVEVLVKEKSGLRNEFGPALMHKVFNEKNPIIKLNRMEEDFEIDEQTGFRFLYVGAMAGIRNPKAHSEIEQKNPYKTLEYISLASLLAKKVEEGKRVSIMGE